MSGGTEENNTARIAGLQVEIRNRDLPNKKAELLTTRLRRSMNSSSMIPFENMIVTCLIKTIPTILRKK
jgi:hypothetical protein